MGYKLIANLENLRNDYPKGTTVELVEMNDAYTKLPKGLNGTFTHVDAIGTIHVNWENGSSLGVVHGVDIIKKIKPLNKWRGSLTGLI